MSPPCNAYPACPTSRLVRRPRSDPSGAQGRHLEALRRRLSLYRDRDDDKDDERSPSTLRALLEAQLRRQKERGIRHAILWAGNEPMCALAEGLGFCRGPVTLELSVEIPAG
jgi:hypothetical protein